MKISKCCKYYTCEEGHSTHWPVIPNIKWRCQKCRELLEASQIWELNDCEIIPKLERPVGIKAEPALKFLEEQERNRALDFITIRKTEYDKLKTNFNAAVNLAKRELLREAPRPKPSSNKRLVFDNGGTVELNDSTRSSKFRGSKRRLSTNKKAKSKRQVRRQVKPSKKS